MFGLEDSGGHSVDLSTLAYRMNPSPAKSITVRVAVLVFSFFFSRVRVDRLCFVVLSFLFVSGQQVEMGGRSIIVTYAYESPYTRTDTEYFVHVFIHDAWCIVCSLLRSSN